MLTFRTGLLYANRVLATETDYYRQFGQLLKRARNAAGLSQEDLAAAIGLTRTSVSNIEKGRQRVLLHTFGRLLHVLKIQPANLLPGPATQASSPSMGLDRLRSNDESGMKFVERAGIGTDSQGGT